MAPVRPGYSVKPLGVDVTSDRPEDVRIVSLSDEVLYGSPQCPQEIWPQELPAHSYHSALHGFACGALSKAYYRQFAHSDLDPDLATRGFQGHWGLI